MHTSAVLICILSNIKSDFCFFFLFLPANNHYKVLHTKYTEDGLFSQTTVLTTLYYKHYYNFTINLVTKVKIL